MRGLRRQYTDILWDRMQRGDVASLLAHGLRWVGTALARGGGDRSPDRLWAPCS